LHLEPKFDRERLFDKSKFVGVARTDIINGDVNEEDDKQYMEEVQHPFEVLIERVDMSPEVQKLKKQNWVKDKAHFDHLKLFRTIQRVRSERREIEDFYGLQRANANDDLAEHMRIANGEIMDEEEEENHFLDILRAKGKNTDIGPKKGMKSERGRTQKKKKKEQSVVDIDINRRKKAKLQTQKPN
jgi:hypothetical protein